MGPPTARQLKSLPAAPPAAPQKGAVALPRGVCSSSIRLIFRPIFLPPPVTCASSGDADSTLSIIDILALCLIFQTLADILVLHQTKAPAYPSSLQYQHITDNRCGLSTFLSPGLGSVSRSAWGDAHRCGEGTAQIPPVREGRRKTGNYGQAQNPTDEGNKPKLYDDGSDHYLGCFRHSC